MLLIIIVKIITTIVTIILILIIKIIFKNPSCSRSIAPNIYVRVLTLICQGQTSQDSPKFTSGRLESSAMLSIWGKYEFSISVVKYNIKI